MKLLMGLLESAAILALIFGGIGIAARTISHFSRYKNVGKK